MCTALIHSDLGFMSSGSEQSIAFGSQGIPKDHPGIHYKICDTPTFASVGAKAKGAWCTPVACSSNHIGPALTLTSVGVTHRA